MKWFLSIALILIALGVFFWPHSSSSRINIVVASSPVAVWSWDKTSDTFIVLEFPREYVIGGAYGYGAYSLESLWKLGFIDNLEGRLLARSLQELLGINTVYFIGEKPDMLIDSPDTLAYGKKIFSLVGSRTSNIPIPSYISFVLSLRKARLDAIVMHDLSEKPITVSVDLPDGTSQDQVDVGKLDVSLKGIFEDEKIRRENLTVAIYNTTQTAFLGTRAARVLANLGVLVVMVGNAVPELDRCLIRGSETSIGSYTVQVIENLFMCETAVAEPDERADIIVSVGTAYAQNF